ncbi:MAG: ABC transporter ATP-binding protein [Candidatus Chisholmbacteria bacterium]|nr:ABC transporter ATP-binding protein [Candidatus Chisholmbacteria bacterium]
MIDVVLGVKNLTKKFSVKAGSAFGRGEFVAVNKVSFELKKGEILGLLGPNGAGKTTTIQMLLGTLTPTSGEISYFGKEFFQHRSEILQEVNYASAYSHLPWRMTVEENLQVYARIYGVKDRRGRIDRLMEEFDVSELRHKTVDALSAGQKTRLTLCKAFINYPKLILLDEPTASLDPDIAVKVRQFLLKQQREYQVSMLFTSHNMAEVTEVCDRVLFLKKGRIVVEDTPEGLARKIKQVEIELMVGDGWEKLAQLCDELKLEWEREEKVARVSLTEKAVAGFLTKLAEREVSYSEISIDKPTLEDFFLAMSRGGLK